MISEAKAKIIKKGSQKKTKNKLKAKSGEKLIQKLEFQEITFLMSDLIGSVNQTYALYEQFIKKQRKQCEENINKEKEEANQETFNTYEETEQMGASKN